jgi:DNA (cytosine-5)-methyltransferase 3A
MSEQSLNKKELEGINVLSLFDGMSCGQIALNEANINYVNYFSSEVDAYTLKVTNKNYPNTKQLGSILSLKGENLPKIDLLFGGSPCQSFSRAGDNTGFEGKSGLFWEFVRVLKEVKPTYFLLENVVMKQEWQDVISEALGVKPIEISSSKFLPQMRKRLYWTNIPNIQQPEQVDYKMSDFIEGEGFPSSCDVKRVFKKKKIFNTLTATYWKGIRGSSRPAVSVREGFLDDDRIAHRMLTPNECEAIQGVPKNYTDCVSKTQRYKMLGNGWTVPVITHIFKHLPEDFFKK